VSHGHETRAAVRSHRIAYGYVEPGMNAILRGSMRFSDKTDGQK
jgi:hypothetical protein